MPIYKLHPQSGKPAVMLIQQIRDGKNNGTDLYIHTCLCKYTLKI